MRQKSDRAWLFLVLIVILLGIFFRCANLGEKVYWVDEVSTSLRLNGYTKQEAIAQLSQQSFVTVSDLQKYQQPSPEKDWSDTWSALKTSPEHSPLYFLLARVWVELWGNSIVAIRSLSVIFSAIALFCLYCLGKELFQSPQISIIAALLMSVSPFFVAYAQEARPYSLWTVTILVSSIALLRAIRHNNWLSWAVYSLSLIFSLYTSLLSILVICSQVIYVIVISIFSLTQRDRDRQDKCEQIYLLVKFCLALLLAFLAFMPWSIVIIFSWDRLRENTAWMSSSLGLLPMLAIWLYSIAIIFIETPVYLALDWLMFVRIVVDFSLFFLVGLSFYFLLTKDKIKTSLFVVCTVLIPRSILILSDLLAEQQASTAPRYMIPLYIGIQLTLAYFFVNKMYGYKRDRSYNRQRKKWSVIFISIISLGIISCTFNLDTSPKYQKTRNIDNHIIADIINQNSNSLLVSEEKNILDLISLSYILERETKIKFLRSFSDNLQQEMQEFDRIFLFNPSLKLKLTLEESNQQVFRKVYRPNLLIPDEIHLSLWQFP